MRRWEGPQRQGVLHVSDALDHRLHEGFPQWALRVPSGVYQPRAIQKSCIFSAARVAG